MSDFALKRRSFVKAITAAGLVTGFPAIIPARSEAADSIKIGLVEPHTGTYAAYGQSEVRGAAFAVEAWNKKGGVMGRQVATVDEDDASDPGIGVQKARKLVNQDKCVALMGTVSSAVSLSVSGAANSLNTVFVDSGGHTDDVTGKDCKWSTFRTCHSTWMETHATGLTLEKKFGKKWYLITPDYAFGHALEAGFKDVAAKIGATIISSELTPLGTTDFSPYLTKVEAAKPDVLVVLVQGEDFVNCLKQANQFGLLKKFPVGGPQVELEAVWALPEAARVGYWGVEWYYKGASVLGAGNKLASDFVAEYTKRHKQPPTARSAFGYISMDRLLWAINEGKSTESVKIAKTLAGAKFKTIFEGETYYRTEDHQLMWPMWVGQIRPKGTPEDKWDVFNIVDRQEAAVIEQTVAEKAKVCKIDFPA